MTNNTRFKNFLILSAFITLLSIFISSCASWLPDAHKPDVTQGNEIKREALNKIHIGMQKSEITSIIGSPMLKDPFHANRWDYIYRFVPGRQKAEQSRLTLFFKDDVLIKIDASEYIELKTTVDKEDKEPEPLIIKEIKED